MRRLFSLIFPLWLFLTTTSVLPFIFRIFFSFAPGCWFLITSALLFKGGAINDRLFNNFRLLFFPTRLNLFLRFPNVSLLRILYAGRLNCFYAKEISVLKSSSKECWWSSLQEVLRRCLASRFLTKGSFCFTLRLSKIERSPLFSDYKSWLVLALLYLN